MGYLSNIIENHDEPRGVSRYIPAEDLCETSKKLLAAVSFMLRGLPWIYQGQEIGMENLSFISIDEFDDVSTLDEYRVAKNHGFNDADALRAVAFYSRDNARTPFQWDDSPNAGFTTGTPWLRVNPNYTEINAEKALEDPDSIFYYYQKLISLRKKEPVLIHGSFELLCPEDESVFAYTREWKGKKWLVICNFYEKPADFSGSGMGRVILSNYEQEPAVSLEGMKLRPYEAMVCEMI